MSLFVLAIGLFLGGDIHDIRLARFRISEAGGKYELSVNFDRADFLKTIYATKEYQPDVLSQAKVYVTQHLSISINQEQMGYEFQAIEYTDTNVILRGALETGRKKIKEIFITNTCLIDDVDGQLNIMEFFLNGKKRFFKLDKKRTQTTIAYN